MTKLHTRVGDNHVRGMICVELNIDVSLCRLHNRHDKHKIFEERYAINILIIAIQYHIYERDVDVRRQCRDKV